MKIVNKCCFKKGNKKKFSLTKSIPPDQSSLKIKILCCNFEDLCLSHKEPDQKLPMHAVYASMLHKRPSSQMILCNTR